jgi:hypothetical protein
MHTNKPYFKIVISKMAIEIQIHFFEHKTIGIKKLSAPYSSRHNMVHNKLGSKLPPKFSSLLDLASDTSIIVLPPLSYELIIVREHHLHNSLKSPRKTYPFRVMV